MKKIKFSMFAVLAIIIGIAASAFTASKKQAGNQKEVIVVTWFQFTGDPANLSQIKNNTLYEYTTGSPCSGSADICAVQTTGSASPNQHPEAFSSDLKQRLTNVFNGNGTYADISQEN